MVEQFQNSLKNGDSSKSIALLQTSPELINAKLPNGVSLLLLTAYHRSQDVLQQFLNQRSNLDFFEAAATGNKQLVVEMIAEDSDKVNQYSADGFTALGLASYFGQFDIVVVLLKAGADVNLVSKNGMQVSPLHAAVAHRNAPITKVLLEHGADANAKQQLGVTPLHSAAHHGDSEIVKLLLNHQADRLAQMDNGKKPVDLAREDDHQEVITILDN